MKNPSTVVVVDVSLKQIRPDEKKQMIHPTDMNENKWMDQLVSKDQMNHLFSCDDYHDY